MEKSQLNNTNVKKYATDSEARWGAKGKNKIWFGYKRHTCVDMRFGLIDKLCVTPANVLDFQVLKEICPENCMAFMDKLYDTKGSHLILQTNNCANNCASGIIQKNNNKQKNKDLDKWRSKTRMPFESTFSKLRKRTRYRGTTKVLFQCFAESLVHNFKKALTILPASTGTV